MDIRDLRKQKSQAVSEIDLIRKRAGDETRALNETETKEVDRLLKSGEELAASIEREERLEALRGQSARQVTVTDNTPAEFLLGTFCRHLAQAGGRPDLAVRRAEAEGASRVAKALGVSTLEGGGVLVPEDLLREIIPLLRAQAVVRRAGAREMPMPSGNLTLPRVSTGATFGYVVENANLSKTEPTLAAIRMTGRKFGGVIPVSNDLVRQSGVAVDGFIRDEIVSAFGPAEDSSFLFGSGLDGAVKGIYNWVASTNTTTMTATPTYSTAAADLGWLASRLASNNIRFLKPAWLMHPRLEIWLKFLMITDGGLAFPEMAQGMLRGFPYYSTTGIPATGYSSTNESVLFLADMAEVVIGDTIRMAISVSDTAAYYNNSAVVAAFSLDQTVFRVLAVHDIAVRQTYAIATKTGMTWGA